MAGNKKSLGSCALITGASSGIGAEFARILSRQGVFVLLTGRNTKALEDLKAELDGKSPDGSSVCEIFTADLSKPRECIDLFAKVKKYDPDILINNAGFGIYGEFTETSLTKELELIDVNIKGMHILFKLFVKEFVKKGRGHILNVASSAGLLAGPLMSAYYSSKAYVIRQSLAVSMELAVKRSGVRVSVLCPGPVDTNFNRRAGITGFFKGITAEKCAEYTLDKMGRGSVIIIPTVKVKAIALFAKLAPWQLSALGAYILQKGKKRIDE